MKTLLFNNATYLFLHRNGIVQHRLDMQTMKLPRQEGAKDILIF